MKVVLVPGMTRGIKRSDHGKLSLSLGVLSLSSCLKQDGHEVEIFDFDKFGGDHAGGFRFAVRQLSHKAADVYGFYVAYGLLYPALEVARHLKRQLPTCTVALGGPHASAVHAEIIENFAWIDIVIRGESELSFCEYLHSLHTSKAASIPGTTGRGVSGIVINSDRSLISNLDDLPIPDYAAVLGPDHSEDTVPLDVGRGCPYRCTFCSTSRFWRGKYRTKSPVRIVEEMAFLQAHHKTYRVFMMHDCLTASERYTMDLCSSIRGAGLKMKWGCAARIDHLNQNLLTAMRSSGCDHIEMGIETASLEVRHSIHKEFLLPNRHESVPDLLRNLHDMGFSVVLYFMCAFPWEDQVALAQTLNLIERCMETLRGNGFFRLSPLQLFPGSPFWDQNEASFFYDPGEEPNLLRYPPEFRSLAYSNSKLFPEFWHIKNKHGLSQDHFSLIADYYNSVVRVMLVSFPVSLQVLRASVQDALRYLLHSWPAFRTFLAGKSTADDQVIIDAMPRFVQGVPEIQKATLPNYFADLINYESAVALARYEHLALACKQMAPHEPSRRRGVKIFSCNTDIAAVLEVLKGNDIPWHQKEIPSYYVLVPKAKDRVQVVAVPEILSKFIAGCDGTRSLDRVHVQADPGGEYTLKDLVDAAQELGALDFPETESSSC